MMKTAVNYISALVLLHSLEAHNSPGTLIHILFKDSSQSCSQLPFEISSILLITPQTKAHITNPEDN